MAVGREISYDMPFDRSFVIQANQSREGLFDQTTICVLSGRFRTPVVGRGATSCGGPGTAGTDREYGKDNEKIPLNMRSIASEI